MAMPNGPIFPVHIYGALNAKYGTNITQYNTAPNTSGFPKDSGLQLGTWGLLFDGTQVMMLKAGGAIAQYDFVTPTLNLSNRTTVFATNAAVQNMTAVNDRVGGALVANDFAWMTTYGLGTGNVAAGVAAGSFLASSAAVAGRAVLSATETRAWLPNVTVAAGSYPVVLR